MTWTCCLQSNMDPGGIIPPTKNFRGLSTTRQLHSTGSTTLYYTGSVFLDVAKDSTRSDMRVSSGSYVTKMPCTGFRLLKLIASYLFARIFRVRLRIAVSQFRSMRSGVPPGIFASADPLYREKYANTIIRLQRATGSSVVRQDQRIQKCYCAIP